MNKPQKSETQLLHTQVCQALDDPTRIMTLYLLASGPKSVGELAEELEVNQPTVSRHLKVLRDRGMVSTQRFGTTIMYSLADKRLIDALDLMRAIMADNLVHQTELVGITAHA
ncbi:MAG: metalloregulator ArsR/SmtB family transcription factor [Anaerolineae bacterium]